MRELFTTPRWLELQDAKAVLDENSIDYHMKEERREFGIRYCLYVTDDVVDKAALLVDERLCELGSDRRGE
jgi:hypothetical protein